MSFAQLCEHQARDPSGQSLQVFRGQSCGETQETLELRRQGTTYRDLCVLALGRDTHIVRHGGGLTFLKVG